MTGSRHSRALYRIVSRDFMPATAEAVGEAVAVTYRELIIARARAFRRPLLRRYPLRDVTRIRHIRGWRVSCLLIDLAQSPTRTVMILYDRHATGQFRGLISTLQRLSSRARWRGLPPRIRRAAPSRRGFARDSG